MDSRLCIPNSKGRSICGLLGGGGGGVTGEERAKKFVRDANAPPLAKKQQCLRNRSNTRDNWPKVAYFLHSALTPHGAPPSVGVTKHQRRKKNMAREQFKQ